MNTSLDQYALIYKNISTKLLKQFFVVSPVTSTYLDISLKSGKKKIIRMIKHYSLVVVTKMTK